MGDATGMKTALRYPVPLYVFLVLAGLTGAGLVIASISLFGPGLTHDSAAYIFAAKSLLEGKGFEYFGYPSPFIQWPPLYPILLAAAGILGIGHLEASGAINAAAHGLIIVITGYWLYSRLNYKFFAIFGTVLLVFSLPLLQVSRYLWTETLFILFFILFYIYFEKFIKTRRHTFLVTAGVFAALACLDRYAGVTIVLAAALFLLFRSTGNGNPRDKSLSKGMEKVFLAKVRDTFIFGVISCLPFTLWVARNYIVSSTLLGVRLPSTYGLRLNIKRSLLSVYAWVTPDALLSGMIPPQIIPVLMAFTVLIPAIVIIIFLLVFLYKLIERTDKEQKSGLLSNNGQRKELVGSNYTVLFMTAFAFIYTAYLLASATKVLFEPINSRYLVPLYMPFLLVFIFALNFLYGKFARSMNSYLQKGAIILLALFLLYPALNTVAAVSGYSAKGAGGYSTKALQESRLVAYVRQNPQDCTYYSNSADMVSALSGVRTYYPPKLLGPDMYGLEQFKKAVEKDACSSIVWFKNSVSSTIYGIEDIGKLYTLEIIEEYEDGTVYRIKK